MEGENVKSRGKNQLLTKASHLIKKSKQIKDCCNLANSVDY